MGAYYVHGRLQKKPENEGVGAYYVVGACKGFYGIYTVHFLRSQNYIFVQEEEQVLSSSYCSLALNPLPIYIVLFHLGNNFF